MMRFLVWCGCVTVCLVGLEVSLSGRDGWRWVWIPLLAFYGFAGIGIAVFGVVKILNGKLGAGLGRKELASLRATPAPRKPEMERGPE